MTNDNEEAERSVLQKTIWRMANDLPVSVDGWYFKRWKRVPASTSCPPTCLPICKSARGSDPNLNETLARVFKDTEASAINTDSEADLKGLFDDLDVHSSKLGSRRHARTWISEGSVFREGET